MRKRRVTTGNLLIPGITPSLRSFISFDQISKSVSPSSACSDIVLLLFPPLVFGVRLKDVLDAFTVTSE